jgi:transcriptional regulator with XRE-family HTH domain
VPAPDPLLVGLGEVIRDLREQRRMSQERLSLESGVHRNYIGGIERAERRPTIVAVATLASTLGIRPSDLMAQAERKAEVHGASWPPAAARD